MVRDNVVYDGDVFDCLSIIYPKIRNKETDDVYKKVFEDSSKYDYFIDGYHKPMDYLDEIDWFGRMCDWETEDLKPFKTNYCWLSTRKDVRNAYNLFGSLCATSIINQCKKIIDIKQFIISLCYTQEKFDSENQLKDCSYNSLITLYHKICPNVFYICGFTKHEWNEYIKDKPIDVYYFVKVFNNLVYKLYKNIQIETHDKNGAFSYVRTFVDRECVYHKYKLEDIIYASNFKNDCAPTFMPQTYSWFDGLVRYCKNIT